MQRQHTQYTAIQTMLLPALSPCTILPSLSIRDLFPSQCRHCLCDSTLTTATQDCSQCQIHLVTLQAECLVSALKHNRAKSEQSQGDCNNQPKWLSEEEKPYHTLCESLKHFGDLGSNCSALTKMFYKSRAAVSAVFMGRLKLKRSI